MPRKVVDALRPLRTAFSWSSSSVMRASSCLRGWGRTALPARSLVPGRMGGSVAETVFTIRSKRWLHRITIDASRLSLAAFLVGHLDGVLAYANTSSAWEHILRDSVGVGLACFDGGLSLEKPHGTQ